MTPQQQDAVRAAAHRWLATPYHHCAAVRGVGVDCLMLLCCVFADAGVVPFVDPRPYPTDWMLHHSDEVYLAGLDRYAQRLPADAPPETGDIQMMRFGRTQSHAAIVMDWPQIIHAYQPAGMVTLGSVDEAAFARRLGPRYRLTGAAA